jgi:hypothetical protein
MGKKKTVLKQKLIKNEREKNSLLRTIHKRRKFSENPAVKNLITYLTL